MRGQSKTGRRRMFLTDITKKKSCIQYILKTPINQYEKDKHLYEKNG